MSSRVNPLIVSSKVQFAKHGAVTRLSAFLVAFREREREKAGCRREYLAIENRNTRNRES